MNRRTLSVVALLAVVAAAAALMTARSHAEEEIASTTGTVKTITLSLDGANAGRIYFELTASEAGAPSSFKIEASNTAAVAILTAARSAAAAAAAIPAPVKVKRRYPAVTVSYKPDFTVTAIEF